MLGRRRDRDHDTASEGRARGTSGKLESALPAPAPVHQCCEERELLGQVREHRLEPPLDSACPRAARVLGVARFAPRRELRSDRLLHGLAVCEGGGKAHPIPAPLDHLSQRAHRQPPTLLGERLRVALEEPDSGRAAPPGEADRDARALARPGWALEGHSLHHEPNAAGVMGREDRLERGIEHGREVGLKDRPEECGI